MDEKRCEDKEAKTIERPNFMVKKIVNNKLFTALKHVNTTMDKLEQANNLRFPSKI